MRLDEAIIVIREAYESAMTQHPKPYNSQHEAFAILKEEVDELWEEIRKKDRNRAAVRLELTHVGAVVIRFLVEQCAGNVYQCDYQGLDVMAEPAPAEGVTI
jgi:NTP pyrophosphatase (non-canonical NTP hydrolase)